MVKESMKKMYLFLAVLLLSVAQGLRAEVKSGESGQCTWSLDTETGILTVSAGTEGGAMADYQYVDGESVLDSYVDAPWWADRMNITQVVIKDGVTYIGKLAFNNCRLTDIVVPNSVTKVGEQAFMLCTASTITIGDGVTDIDADAFYCLPYTPDGTFTKQTVTIGAGVKKVGRTAFSYSCIQHLTLKGPAFETWTEAPEALKFKETMIHVTLSNYNDWITKYPDYKPYMDFYAGDAGSYQWTSGDCIVKLNLDYSLTISGSGAMANYATVNDCPWKDLIGNISAVTVGEHVTSLSTNGFVGADNVTDVYLKGDPFTKATWVDYADAFNAATVFTCEKEGWYAAFPDLVGQLVTRCGEGVAWNFKNKVLTISKYADGTGEMNDYTSDSESQAPWHDLTETEIINIEDGVTTIGAFAFNSMNATEISMPASVTTVKRGAFRYSHVKRFEMPAGMTEVPQELFYGSKIEEIVLPEGIKSISQSAFYECDQLKQVFLPSTLESIGNMAFQGVTSAVDIYAYSIMNPNSVTWGSPADDFSENARVHVPTGRSGAWQSRFPSAKVQWVDDAYNADAPMELASTADWRKFRNQVVSGATGIHAKMTADFTISDSDGYVGNSNRAYSGVFDGNGHTLMLNYGERGEGNNSRAPFNCIRGATIKNVHFAGKHENYQYISDFVGSYYKGSWFCAGVVANVLGSGNFIENCRISTNFCYAGSYNGGIAAVVDPGATLTIANVLYDGKFVYGHANNSHGYEMLMAMTPADNNAVLVSYNCGTVNIVNSYINAAELRTISKSSATKYPAYLWAYNKGGTTTLNNCCYKNPGAYLLDASATDVTSMPNDFLNYRMGAMWKQDGDNFIPLWLYAMEGAGTEESPYQIGTDAEWRQFIHYTTLHADQYKGKHWQQTADISGVTKWGAQLLGSDTAPAVYDGNGKTLTVAIVSYNDYVAPIALMQKATVKGVTFKGSIVGGLHTAGLVSMVKGEGNEITNSLVDAEISFGTSNPHAGGFVGHAYTSQLTVKGCKFIGRMEATTESDNSVAGAILGWADNVDNIVVEDCVEKGAYDFIKCKCMNAYIKGTEVYGFGRNCLSFNKLPGGFCPYAITWDTEELALTMGEPLFDYPVAGITNYYLPTLYVFDNYYVGEDQQLTFKLKTVEGYPVRNVKANDTLLEADADGNYNYTVTGPTTITADPALIILKDGEDNSTALTKYNGKTYDVELYGRTFNKDGSWNTICLPFAVESFGLDGQGEVLLGMSNLKELDTENSKFDSATGTLTLKFTEVTSTKAGVPYLVRWSSSGVIEDPVFKNVKINNAAEGVTTADGYVTFVGNYNPVSLTAADNDKLYLGAGNKLYYPNGDMTINAFRAYFQLNKGLTAGKLPVTAIKFVMDGEVTGISSVSDAEIGDSKWFTLDGRCLQGVPTAKGIYITNGKKVVIK